MSICSVPQAILNSQNDKYRRCLQPFCQVPVRKEIHLHMQWDLQPVAPANITAPTIYLNIPDVRVATEIICFGVKQLILT